MENKVLQMKDEEASIRTASSFTRVVRPRGSVCAEVSGNGGNACLTARVGSLVYHT